MDHVRWLAEPTLQRPTVIAAFTGWNDAGDSASSAVRHLVEQWGATALAEIDPEEFTDFATVRPHVRLADGRTRSIVWPTVGVWAASTPGGDVVLVLGPEPALRWRLFTQQLIAIAQRVPARISNLVGIDTVRHLVHAGTPKNPRCTLIFEAEEVKNGKVIEAPLPKSVAALIAEYIERYRHLLADVPTTALFPDRDGRPKYRNTMSKIVQQLLRRRLGFTVNPHSFRHVAAMLFLSINKGDYASVQLILGHKKLETTIKYYTELKADEAFRALDALLEAYVAGKHAH